MQSFTSWTTLDALQNFVGFTASQLLDVYQEEFLIFAMKGNVQERIHLLDKSILSP